MRFSRESGTLPRPEGQILVAVPEVEEAMHWEILALQRRRTLLPLGFPLIALVLLLTLLMADRWGDRLGEWWRGERAWTGERRFDPVVAPDPAALASVEWARLHEELLPRWSLRSGWGRDRTEERESFAVAFTEVSRDPNLALLLGGLREAAQTDPAGQTQRIDYLVWAWNGYLRQLGVPWYLDWSVQAGSKRNGLIIQSYAIRSRTTFEIGERTYPLLVLERADHLNVDDAAMGRTGIRDSVAQVLLGAVRQHAQLRVWPLLHGLSSHATDTDGQFAQAISSEIQKALSPKHFEVLARTAPSFRALLMMRDGIRERRGCENRFRLNRPPVGGYPEEFRAELIRVAEFVEAWSCPPITLDEAATIELESSALAKEPDLEPALVALTAHLIRGVALHEARHVADAAKSAAFERRLVCPGCPVEMGIKPRAEVSAYLASFADELTGASSLHQACRVASGSNANATALGYLLPRLMPGGCTAGPPPDLADRDRRLELELFNRSERIRLPQTPTTDLTARDS